MAAGLETFFPYRLAVSAETFSRSLTEVYGRGYGLTREQWRVLFHLARAGAVDSLELSRRTSLDKVQVSRAAGRLEAKGLIARNVAEADRRLRLYTITSQGEALFARILPDVEARAEHILGSMSADDRAALEQGLAGLMRVLPQGS